MPLLNGDLVSELFRKLSDTVPLGKVKAPAATFPRADEWGPWHSFSPDRDFVFNQPTIIMSPPLWLDIDQFGTSPEYRLSNDGQYIQLHKLNSARAMVTNRINPTSIRLEPNQEVRYQMLKVYGYERFFRETDAQLIHEDTFGKLWLAYYSPQINVNWERRDFHTFHDHMGRRQSVPILATDRLNIDGDFFLMVEVLNASPEPDGTFKTYLLCVPPEMRTARQAVAWTFGMSEYEYHPAVQT